MKIDVEYPNFLMYKLLKAQADLSGVDLSKASEETKIAIAFSAGYNSGFNAISENLIDDIEFETFLDLIARQNKKTETRIEER